MFEQYEKLAKEQYLDFNFDDWELQAVMKTIHGFEQEDDQINEDGYYENSFVPFAYKIPNGYVGCVFTNANPIIDDQMFFMVNIEGIK